MKSQREAFEKYRDKRNAGLEADGLTHASAFWVDNTHYPTWQAATEQGVGEAVAYMVTQSGEFCFATRHRPSISPEEMSDSELDIVPLYTHPPKPTGGGVPESYVKAAERFIAEACCNAVEKLNELAPEQGFDPGERTAEMYIRQLRALLATQQPPEQE